MTPIAFALNGTLMLLLLFAVFVGLKLERRLRGLRDSQANFAKAAVELNAAIARAEVGLGEIRATMKDAEETLTERVDEARAAAKKLETAMTRAASIVVEPAPAAREPTREPARPVLVPAPAAPRATSEDDMAGLPIKDLLARLRGSVAPDQPAPRAAAVTSAEAGAAATRSRARVDDDLFDSPDAFPPLRRAGAGR
jgi:hypothetical protein